jgi:hypothetical protein
MSMEDGSPVRSGRKRALWWLGGVIVTGYVAVILLLVVFQGRLIFLPPANVPVGSPGDAGLSYDDLHIPVQGDGAIHAWWIPSADPHARTILYFHGNAGCWSRSRIVRCRCFDKPAQTC